MAAHVLAGSGVLAGLLFLWMGIAIWRRHSEDAEFRFSHGLLWGIVGGSLLSIGMRELAQVLQLASANLVFYFVGSFLAVSIVGPVAHQVLLHTTGKQRTASAGAIILLLLSLLGPASALVNVLSGSAQASGALGAVLPAILFSFLTALPLAFFSLYLIAMGHRMDDISRRAQLTLMPIAVLSFLLLFILDSFPLIFPVHAITHVFYFVVALLAYVTYFELPS